MKNYEVTIQATITKTYKVKAEDNNSAADVVYEIFDIHNEPNVPEHYKQEIVESREVEA